VLLVIFLTLFLIDWAVFKILLPEVPYYAKNFFSFNIYPIIFILALSNAYRMIQDRIKEDRLQKEKENENLKTELSLLRSQVSPHFMFNIMNNMVALARKKSDILEPSLIKLSSLLRYMLYETDERVALQKEIEYLQSYIDLQKQRFGNNVMIKTCMEKVEDSFEIEPMLLIPFVENAFKHGTGLIENAEIDIELRTEKNRLSFSVRNKFNEASEEVKDKSSGIGLANVQRRLDLLYGNKHSLLITKQDGWFIISLQIVLH
jgi:LytS/YehU family sensor histidine kinase